MKVSFSKIKGIFKSLMFALLWRTDYMFVCRKCKVYRCDSDKQYCCYQHRMDRQSCVKKLK